VQRTLRLEPPLPLDFIRQRFEAGQIWVAIAPNQTVVGYAIARDLETVGERSAHRAIASIPDSSNLYLQEIDVESAHGQQGLGTALFTTVMAWATQQGYRTLLLSTFREIPWNAPFYTKRSFRVLNDTELTLALQQIRAQEIQSGLPIADRVILCRELCPYDLLSQPRL
jgi:GNAT superfamily N-acetyltransferase